MSYIPIIGLMSGTSADGIDLSFIYSNGNELRRTGINDIIPYHEKTKYLIDRALSNPIKFLGNEKEMSLINKLITLDHYYAVKKISKEKKIYPKLIGFHGQTIFHDPKNKKTMQLGDGFLLSKLLKMDVVFNFRTNDIDNGGQGAPIAPIYHKLIINNLKLKLPSVLINIGGISNLTYWDGDILLGFDTGPGNNLMDHFMKVNYNKPFDKNGYLAELGKPDLNLINEFLNHKYFLNSPPKSLERVDLFNNPSFLKISSLKAIDAMATFSYLTALSIKKSFDFLPKKPQNSIIVGGGQNNKFLMSILKQYLTSKTFTSEDFSIPGDFIEAEMIAFLAARKNKNLPSTFASTTGVRHDTVLGETIVYRD